LQLFTREEKISGWT